MSVDEKITPEEEKGKSGKTTCKEDVRADATRERIHKCDDCTHGVRRQTRNKHNKKKTVDKSPRYRAPGWIGIGMGCFEGWDAFLE